MVYIRSIYDIYIADKIKRATSYVKRIMDVPLFLERNFLYTHPKVHIIEVYCFSTLQKLLKANRRQQGMIVRTTKQRRQQEVLEWMHIQLEDYAQSGDLWSRTSEPIDLSNSVGALMSRLRLLRATRWSVYSISCLVLVAKSYARWIIASREDDGRRRWWRTLVVAAH